MKKTTFIAMWSGPRNISTTMMRSFENRPDTNVIDEPLCASYLHRTGANHPYRRETLDTQPSVCADAISWAMEPNPDGEPIKFQKHIAHHLAESAELDWLLETRCFLLIRDPYAMVDSYADKFDDVQPITESFARERQIAEFLDRHNRPCPVLDATDILKAPETMLRALCNLLDIPFLPAMLVWPSGKRSTDGAWAPHWYSAVESSTGFRPYTKKNIHLTPEMEQIADCCRDDYEFLHERRLAI